MSKITPVLRSMPPFRAAYLDVMTLINNHYVLYPVCTIFVIGLVIMDKKKAKYLIKINKISTITVCKISELFQQLTISLTRFWLEFPSEGLHHFSS